MLRTTEKPTLLELGHLTNLQDLRSQLTNRLAMLLIVASGLAMWQSLPQGFFSITAFVLFSALLGLGLGVQALMSNHPTLARYLLVWGLNVGLAIAIGLFPASYLPFLGLLLIFLNALLISGSELATAAIILTQAAWLTYGGHRDYPLFDLGAVLTLGIAVAWLAVNTLYTTLQWTQNMQQRAERLLDEVRNQRAELSRVLKSTEITNSLLRRTQRELIIARKQAEEARRMKEQFAANISHELRTPLNLILGFSEIMSLSPEVYGEVNWPPTLRRDVYQVYRSSRHLVDMIDDILDLSRFEMVGFNLSKEPTPLEPLLRNTASIAADLFRGHPVRLEVDIPSDLPTLELDRTRIRQVLLNLLNNAQRFTPEGTVQLTAKKAGNEVIISVSDTGAGIPAEKLPHIFDEFFQVDLSLRRSHQGAGLGLAISKRFVQLHGGSIWAKSQEGTGSTFSFSLPIKSTYFPPTPATDGAGQPEPSWADKPAPSIVVVDPDPSIATLMRRNFNEYKVVQLTDSTKLKETVMLHHPRAVVINAPPIQPKDHHQDVDSLPVPVIECSLPSQAWLADDLAVVACLTKPVMAERLLGQLAELGDVEDVLIIDDDRRFVQLIRRILETSDRPYKLRWAYSGPKGLLAIQHQRPDLVLLDLMMPDLDGFQVLKEIRQIPDLADVPIVLLTATSFAEGALTHGNSRLVVHRDGGLHSAEVLACLRAVIQVVEPNYVEKSIADEPIYPNLSGTYSPD